jgi:hypothetical protein
MKIFDNMVLAKYGDSMTVAVTDDTELASDINHDSNSDFDFVPYEDDEEIPRSIPHSEVLDCNGKPINTRSITFFFEG